MADPFELNVQGVTDLVTNSTNKVPVSSQGSPEGQSGERIDVLSLDMSDEELLAIRDELEKNYAPYEAKINVIAERNLESYLGKRKDGQWLDTDGPSAANLQFEAEETFLASALSKNPEPVVFADNTPEGNIIAKDVKTMLSFHSDQLVLRRKLGLMVRQWSIRHLAVLKHGWRQVNDITDGKDIGDIDTSNRPIQNFVFDPQGYVDAYGNFIGWLGERIEVKAQTLAELFPDHKEYIMKSVDNKGGTKVKYTEWWSDDNTFCFYTYKEIVLDKHKNEYFNYPEQAIDPVTGQPQFGPGEVAIDEETGLEVMQQGEPVMVTKHNHFSEPQKPYTFLSVFSLQEQPHDITGLVEQNIANQRKITKRSEQIDYNVEASNNGYAYSEDNFNEETAKQASGARRKGNPILIPSGGPIDKAIMPLPAQDLPNGIFAELEITKADLRSSWGVTGITASVEDDDETARGEIIEQNNDTTRIGGGIGDCIEQVAKNVFNWWVQLYSVFYDDEHFAAIMGNAKAVEYVTLTNARFDRPLVVSVSPDSLKPKDEVSQINMAQALFDKGAIGPKTLLKMLDFPDPDESAADGVMYRLDPMAYMQLNFPEYAAKLQQAMQQQQMLQAQSNVMMGNNPDGSPQQPPVPEPAGESTIKEEKVDAKGNKTSMISKFPLPSLTQGGPAG